ncbi:MAG: BLUF domain-containing protein, partial [Moraxellaceae bacterium]
MFREILLSQLIRLTYASTTASTPATIREDLVHILNKARAYNAGNNIHGVLFYGNNYFFQCLEGDEKRVDRLYQQILKDSRHKNVVLLTRESISAPKF